MLEQLVLADEEEMFRCNLLDDPWNMIAMNLSGELLFIFSWKQLSSINQDGQTEDSFLHPSNIEDMFCFKIKALLLYIIYITR